MESVKVKVKNPTGIHAKPASMIVEEASQFSDTQVNIKNGSTVINAKSILGILGLEAVSDTELEIQTEGPSEKEAAEKVAELFKSNFGEE